MIATLLFVVALQGAQVVVQGGPPPKPVPRDAPATLPDTPQAKRVKAYIDAFNSGDEATFLKTQEELMTPEVLAKRPADQWAKMYARMRGDFKTMKITRATATSEEIRVIIPNNDGDDAIFSFEFEAKAPYKIKSIAIDIGNVQR
jgi:hypothetical protein